MLVHLQQWRSKLLQRFLLALLVLDWFTLICEPAGSCVYLKKNKDILFRLGKQPAFVSDLLSSKKFNPNYLQQVSCDVSVCHTTGVCVSSYIYGCIRVYCMRGNIAKISAVWQYLKENLCAGPVGLSVLDTFAK